MPPENPDASRVCLAGGMSKAGHTFLYWRDCSGQAAQASHRAGKNWGRGGWGGGGGWGGTGRRAPMPHDQEGVKAQCSIDDQLAQGSSQQGG